MAVFMERQTIWKMMECVYYFRLTTIGRAKARRNQVVSKIWFCCLKFKSRRLLIIWRSDLWTISFTYPYSDDSWYFKETFYFLMSKIFCILVFGSFDVSCIMKSTQVGDLHGLRVLPGHLLTISLRVKELIIYMHKEVQSSLVYVWFQRQSVIWYPWIYYFLNLCCRHILVMFLLQLIHLNNCLILLRKKSISIKELYVFLYKLN